jgi:uncharacterized CHY-type Zn-finger protein
LEFEDGIAINGTDWEQSVLNIFAQEKIAHFLISNFNIEISEVDTVAASYRLMEHNARMSIRERYRKAKKLRESLEVEHAVKVKSERVVKEEAAAAAAAAVAAANAVIADSSSSSSSSSSSRSSSSSSMTEEFKKIDLTDLEDDDLSKIGSEEATVIGNYKRMVAEATERSKEAQARGIKPVIVFADPQVMVEQPSEKFFLKVKDPKGNTVFCKQESDASQTNRMVAFDSLVASIKGVSSAVIKSVARGNVSKLFDLVVDTIIPTGREMVMTRIRNNFGSIRKTPNEVFRVFKTRFEDLVTQAISVGMSFQECELRGFLDRALSHGCSSTQSAYKIFLVTEQNSRGVTYKVLLERMNTAMTALEVKNTQDKMERVGEKNEEQRKLDRQEKKDRKKTEKALRAQAVTDESRQRDWRADKTCIDFQTDNCKFGQRCYFKHEKVSAQALAELKKKKEEALEKLSQIVCYKCKEMGHFANKCPNSQSGSRQEQAQVRQVSQSDSKTQEGKSEQKSAHVNLVSQSVSNMTEYTAAQYRKMAEEVKACRRGDDRLRMIKEVCKDMTDEQFAKFQKAFAVLKRR